MRKQTLFSILGAGVLTVGALSGLVGFADKDTMDVNQRVSLVSTADIDTAQVETTGQITGVSDVAAAVMPAVVSITNRSVQEVRNYFYGGRGFWGSFYGYDGYDAPTYERESVSAGSGIIIGQNDEELLICTNNHVVEKATELTVGFVDEEAYEAVVKGTDEANDLAVIAVKLDDISDDTMDAIRIAEIGNSEDLLVGEQVVAIGNALGYGQSVTTGIVSALNRPIRIDDFQAEMIQTDAAINPGNSGGALLDMKGRVIGINSAKASEYGVEGMGYAIPITTASPILEDLMNRKTRTETVAEEDSAYIGMNGQAVSDEMSELYGIPKGVYVTDVAENSPAAEAGLHKGDIITKFDGSSVTTMSQLREALAYYAAGEEVTVTVSRASGDGYEEEKLTLTLASRQDYVEEQED